MPRVIKLRLIYPASRDKQDTSPPQKIELKNGSFELLRKAIPPPSDWDHLAASSKDRLDELLDALFDEECEAIICGRGGYGASDLLHLIPWADLKGLSPRTIIGFSDISALHSAFYTQLGWQGLHAPMPASSYWSMHVDIDLPKLFQVLAQPESTSCLQLQQGLAYANQSEYLEGWLYGGCLSVLSSLIGTPFFPENLNGAIVFWEDIDEPVGRIFRHINQWLQSGSLAGAKAIVLGQFTQNEQLIDIERLAQEIAVRVGLPVFTSLDFGHCSPNLPLMVGGLAAIKNDQLIWKRSPRNGTLST